MNAEFIAAVRPVIAWARANGWDRDAYKGHYRSDVWKVRPMRTAIEVRPKSSDGRWWGASFEVPVSSTQQAVDVLTALGVLPPHLSSQWQAGRDMALTAAAALLPNLEPVPDFVEGHPIGQRSH